MSPSIVRAILVIMVSRETRLEIRGGIKDSLLLLGIVPVSIAYGLLIHQAGFAWWWAFIFSFLMNGGSVQFITLTLMVTGASPFTAFFTGFLVNFRHLFYGLTFPRDIITYTGARGALLRTYSIYQLTDECYAMVSHWPAHHRTAPRLLAFQSMIYAYWMIPSSLAALAGDLLPSTIEGLDFAMPALFVILVIEAMKSTHDLSVGLCAVCVAILFFFLFPTNMLIPALVCLLILLWIRFLNPKLDRRLVLSPESISFFRSSRRRPTPPHSSSQEGDREC